MVGIFARDELAIVEADTVVEQQLDIVRNQRSAVFVDGMLQFRPYLIHTFENGFAFLSRKMQCFVCVIGKIGIFFYQTG